MPKRNLLDFIEYVFIAGSSVGTVAALITQQGMFAVTPITIAIVLNIINRQRLNQLNLKQVEYLQRLIQDAQENQYQIHASLNKQIDSFSQREEELQKLTSLILQNQQHIEELKIKLTHSNQSINSLAQQLNLIDNSTLNFDI
ncbi:MAG: hypothetical protein ACRC80_00325, partial [Waterburya sp.]